MTISIQDQVRCAQRELAMRLKVYPNSVQLRRMSQAQCDKEIAAMSAIVATLQKVQALWEVSEEIRGPIKDEPVAVKPQTQKLEQPALSI